MFPPIGLARGFPHAQVCSQPADPGCVETAGNWNQEKRTARKLSGRHLAKRLITHLFDIVPAILEFSSTAPSSYLWTLFLW